MQSQYVYISLSIFPLCNNFSDKCYPLPRSGSQGYPSGFAFGLFFPVDFNAKEVVSMSGVRDEGECESVSTSCSKRCKAPEASESVDAWHSPDARTHSGHVASRGAQV